MGVPWLPSNERPCLTRISIDAHSYESLVGIETLAFLGWMAKGEVVQREPDSVYPRGDA